MRDGAFLARYNAPHTANSYQREEMALEHHLREPKRLVCLQLLDNVCLSRSLLLRLAGALGLGLPAASGITLTFSFLSYVLPILAGMLADARWGMFKTIVVSSFIGIVGVSAFSHFRQKTFSQYCSTQVMSF